MADPKAPITCHILDTALGHPAANVRVRLELTPSPPSAAPARPPGHSPAAPAPPPPSPHPTSLPIVFESTTNADGRVATWLPYSAANAAGEVPVYTLEDVLGDIRGASRWTLRFDTDAYFAARGTATFFPEVVVVFEVQEGQRYHVPLLLAPFGYSTYRGS